MRYNSKYKFKKGIVMKNGSTMALRAIILIIGILALVFCTVALPSAIKSELAGDFDYGPIFIGMLVLAIPFFIALRQALALLGHMDKGTAFSELSVKAIGNIRRCALAISGLYALGMPYIFYVADRDDAPGVAALGFVIIGASFVVAVFAAVLQKLLRDAVRLQKENELTV